MRALLLASVMALGWAATANADVVVPSAYATSEAPATTNGPLGSAGVDGGFVGQYGYAASLLNGIAVGSSITSVGFRLDAMNATVAETRNFSQFDVRLGSSVRPIDSLDRNFAANQGADTTLVRSGALTINGGSLIGGSSVNPFYEIVFTLPYIYFGGDILLTINSTFGRSDNAFLDAVRGTEVNSVIALRPNSAQGDFIKISAVPVVQFGITPPSATDVPEPASLALFGLGAAGVLTMRRRQINRSARSAPVLDSQY